MVAGAYLSAVCESGTLVQTWTAALLVGIDSCNDTALTARFAAWQDPVPFFWRARNVSIRAPLPNGGTFETNSVRAQLPQGAPAPLSLVTSAGELVSGAPTFAWGDQLFIQGTWLGRAAARGDVAAFAAFSTWSAGAAASGASSFMMLVPAPAPPLLANNTASFRLRFVASAPCVAAANESTAGCMSSFGLFLSFTSVSAAEDMASLERPLLLAGVSPLSIDQPALIPRAGLSDGGASSPASTSGNQFSVRLPQPGWTAAEMLTIGARAECKVLAGASFSVTFPCPSSSSFNIPVPQGFGTRIPLILQLAGGILNISLGNISYAPSGVTSVVPNAVFVPLASAERPLLLNLSFAEADDAAFVEGVCLIVQEASAPSSATVCCAAVSLVLVQSSPAVPSAATLRCAVWPHALRAALPADADAVKLSFVLLWGAMQLPVSSAVALSAVAAPVLQAIAPATVSPGSTIIVIGANFCRGIPDGACPSSSSNQQVGAASPPPILSLFVGGQPCSAISVLTDGLATCTAPTLRADEPGYPSFPALLLNGEQVRARQTLTVSYPSSGYVRALAPLPTTFLPSDATAPVPLRPVKVGVSRPDGRNVTDDIECGLSPRTPGVLLVPLAAQPDLSAVRGAAGVVDFGLLAMQAPFSVGNVTLTAACTIASGADSGSSTLSLTWRVEVEPLSQLLCTTPPSTIASLQALPPLLIALRPLHAHKPAGQNAAASVAAACSAGRASNLPLPPVTCLITAAGQAEDAAGAALVQNGRATVNTSSAQAVFKDVSVGGQIDVLYTMSAQCSIGSVAIPPSIAWTLRLTGCSIGSEPQGSLCAPCPAGSYSDGGAASCRRCPAAGVTCSSGFLQALQGFYRPPAQALLPLDAMSELHACPFPDRCLVNDTIAGSSSSTDLSSQTLSANATNAVDSIALSASVPVASWAGSMATPAASMPGVAEVRQQRMRTLQLVSASNSSANTSAAVDNLILSRRWFCATGTAGPLCARCDEENQFALVGTQCMPCTANAVNQAAVAAVVLLYVVAVSAVALRKRDPTGRTEDAIALRVLLTHVQAAGSIRAFRVSGTQLYKQIMAFTDILSPSVVGQGPLECALRPSFGVVFYGTLILPLITAALALCILLLATVLNVGPASSVGSTVRQRLAAAVQMRAHTALLLFVLQLAYMPIVSSCLGVLDCTQPIDGVRYLTADVRVECRGSGYLLMTTASALGLACVGLGFPLVVFCRLHRVTAAKLADPHFAAAWSFLFTGYRQPAVLSTTQLRLEARSHAERAVVAAAPSPERGFTNVNPLAARSAEAESSPPSSAERSDRVAVDADHGVADSAQSVVKLRICGACVPQRLRQTYTCARDVPANMSWFESTVLLRKASIVFLARLVPNAITQTACFELMIVVFIIMHTALRPYVAWRHQFAEGLSLFCLAVTAALANLVQPAAAIGQTGTVAVTALMLALNFFTVAFLAHQYLQLCCAVNRRKVRGAASSVKQRVLRLSLRNGTSSSASQNSSGGRTRSRKSLSPALKLVAAGQIGRPRARAAFRRQAGDNDDVSPRASSDRSDSGAHQEPQRFGGASAAIVQEAPDAEAEGGKSATQARAVMVLPTPNDLNFADPAGFDERHSGAEERAAAAAHVVEGGDSALALPPSPCQWLPGSADEPAALRVDSTTSVDVSSGVQSEAVPGQRRGRLSFAAAVMFARSEQPVQADAVSGAVARFAAVSSRRTLA